MHLANKPLIISMREPSVCWIDFSVLFTLLRIEHFLMENWIINVLIGLCRSFTIWKMSWKRRIKKKKR